MAGTAIEVAGLRVRYAGASVDAVAGIDFAVAVGEVFGFLGPNGAGKSTTQRVLTGQQRAFTGSVTVLGRSVRDWGRGLYQRIGVGFELPACFPKLTGRENLAAFAALYDGRVEPVADMLAAVGLADVADRRAAEYSKGMKMRLNLARALLHRPDVLFLDEPTSGLDPVSAEEVRAIIRAHAAAGRTIFLTTHDMATADELCDRVAFLHQGRLAAVDTPRRLKLAHGHRAVAVEYAEDGELRRAEFDGPDDPRLLALLGDGAVQTVHSREASLAEVFVAVAGARL
ncbi:MAG TPA: ABC transporter ATP-binding protein [Pilimelia sp.]|nr:ABC transporter ATP-binding protein [Pilimelia sp.]